MKKLITINLALLLTFVNTGLCDDPQEKNTIKFEFKFNQPKSEEEAISKLKGLIAIVGSDLNAFRKAWAYAYNFTSDIEDASTPWVPLLQTNSKLVTEYIQGLKGAEREAAIAHFLFVWDELRDSNLAIVRGWVYEPIYEVFRTEAGGTKPEREAIVRPTPSKETDIKYNFPKTPPVLLPEYPWQLLDLVDPGWRYEKK